MKRIVCPDCDQEYEAGQPHSMFCEARTCDECQTTVAYVIAKDVYEQGRRICDGCIDKLNFPEDYEDDDA